MKDPRGFTGWIDDRVMAIIRAAQADRVRLEVIRILASLAIVGFMASRIVNAEDWLSTDSFLACPLQSGERLAAAGVVRGAVGHGMAWTVAIALGVSGLAVAAGAYTRIASAVFTVLLFYVALADRLSAFTVSKIGPVIVLALFLTPSGSRWSVDAWLRRRREPGYAPPELVSGGCVRFFQFMLPVFYCSSGVRKALGDWMPGTKDYNAVRAVDPPPRLLSDPGQLVPREPHAGVVVDRAAADHARVRGARAGVVRAALDAPVRDRVGARDAPDDRPDVRAGAVVRAADDGARRGQLSARESWLRRVLR